MQSLYNLYEKYWLGELDWEPVPFTPPKFDIKDPAAKEYLKEHGYVVFKNVANEQEIAHARSLFWDFVELVKGWEGEQVLFRNDATSWKNEWWPAEISNGIMFRNGVGQSPFLWYCRTLPNVANLFRFIWDDDDVLTSFDGCGVFRPPEVDASWTTRGGWFHIDQNCYRKPGRHAVQGLLNLYKSGEEDGGLVVVPKSTHMIDTAFSTVDDICSKTKNDYVRINRDTTWWKQHRRSVKNNYDYRPIKLCLDAGDFALWDSRCIHCNTPPSKLSEDPEAKKQLKRLTAYICMTPARLAKDIETLAKQRIFAFQNGFSTNHWPHEFTPNGTKVHAAEWPVGATHVKLTKEQAQLITGKQCSHLDIYEKLGVDDVKLE
jgi:hypothetical protein